MGGGVDAFCLAADVVEVDDKEEVVDNESWAGVEPRLGLRGRSPT